MSRASRSIIAGWQTANEVEFRPNFDASSSQPNFNPSKPRKSRGFLDHHRQASRAGASPGTGVQNAADTLAAASANVSSNANSSQDMGSHLLATTMPLVPPTLEERRSAYVVFRRVSRPPNGNSKDLEDLDGDYDQELNAHDIANMTMAPKEPHNMEQRLRKSINQVKIEDSFKGYQYQHKQ